MGTAREAWEVGYVSSWLHSAQGPQISFRAPSFLHRCIPETLEPGRVCSSENVVTWMPENKEAMAPGALPCDHDVT